MANIPFFLFTTGSVPPVPPTTSGGVRSMLAFWAGGASSIGTVPPSPPPPPPPPTVQQPGGVGSLGKPHRRAEYRDALEQGRRSLARQERQELVRQVDELVRYLEQNKPETVTTAAIDSGIDWIAGAFAERSQGIEFEQQLMARVAETARLIAEQDDEDAITAILLLS